MLGRPPRRRCTKKRRRIPGISGSPVRRPTGRSGQISKRKRRIRCHSKGGRVSNWVAGNAIEDPSTANTWTESARGRYLVDPASSHMLVSKIKPCMSKYTPLHGETANGSLNQLWFLRSYNPTWITVAILELIHATQLRPARGRALLLAQNQSGSARQTAVRLNVVTPNNFVPIACPSGGDASFKCLPYQLDGREKPSHGDNGYGESGFDSGE